MAYDQIRERGVWEQRPMRIDGDERPYVGRMIDPRSKRMAVERDIDFDRRMGRPEPSGVGFLWFMLFVIGISLLAWWFG